MEGLASNLVRHELVNGLSMTGAGFMDQILGRWPKATVDTHQFSILHGMFPLSVERHWHRRLALWERPQDQGLRLTLRVCCRT